MNEFIKEFSESKVIVVCRGIAEEEIVNAPRAKLLGVVGEMVNAVYVIALAVKRLFLLFVCKSRFVAEIVDDTSDDSHSADDVYDYHIDIRRDQRAEDRAERGVLGTYNR